MRHARWSAFPLVAVLLVFVACGGGGSSSSTTGTPTPATAPLITGQPGSIAVTQGSAVTFTVTATGTAPLAYQWGKGGADISNATTSSYSIGSAQVSDAGSYYVKVSNSAGTVTSNSAVLTVNLPVLAPGISTQPASQSVTVGQSAVFSVVATGTAPLTYQWAKNGTAISGATSASYNTPITVLGDNGSTFTVTVTNAAGGLVSNAATLAVTSTAVAPGITQQPSSQTVTAGQSGTFSVVATGTSPLAYQWSRNGVTISGAISATYVTPATTVADSGATFSVKVSNAVGSASSNQAVLSVSATAGVPAINGFTASPTSIGLGAGSVLSWDVVGATLISINNGVGALSSSKGSVNVSPILSTTFTLTASNASGTATATAAVVVDGTPFRLTSLSATDPVVPFGGLTTLSWGFAGTPVNMTLNGSPITGTSTQVSPQRRQTFTLTGSNAGGADSRTVKVAAQGLDLVAGSGAGAGCKDGPALLASFSLPWGVAVDKSGLIYVADAYNNTIRKIAADGTVSTLAGTAGMPGSADGTGSAARFNAPHGLVVDASGNLYVSDAGNNTIRKITSTGTVTTFAGTAGQVGSTDNQGANARFNRPNGLAMDASGNLYVADSSNYTIRKIDQLGNVVTLAGSAGLAGKVEGQGALARFRSPVELALDAGGNLYVADVTNNAIRKVSPGGLVSTFAGTGYSGYLDGPGTTATFYYPYGLAVDGSGNVYVVDRYNQTIRRITSGGVVSTVAGTLRAPGYANGLGSAASFYYPIGMALHPSGNLIIVDSSNNSLRSMTPAGQVSQFAGTAWSSGSADGTAANARFNEPQGIALDSEGNTYVADNTNHTIRKISPTGVVTTLAGLAGQGGALDGQGATARFSYPNAVCVDATGNVFVADTGNQTIRKITPGGYASTYAGKAGVVGSTDSSNINATFNVPTAVAVDGSGNVYVADTGNCTIRIIYTYGYVSTLAGSVGAYAFLNGNGTQAKFNQPNGITLDDKGNLFIADWGNNCIRKIDAYRNVTTLAGNPTLAGNSDGIGSSAQFSGPYFLALAPSGDLYVTDQSNLSIRRVTQAGVVSTIAGSKNRYWWEAGPLPGSLNDVAGIAVTPDGDLLVAISHALIQVTAPAAAGAPTIAVPPMSQVGTLGQPATFSVIPGGLAPFTYQWSKNGTAITGATAGTYTTSALIAADDGSTYQVVVSNAAGSVTSPKATLSVTAAVAPIILLQPTSQSVAAGETTTFTVVAASSMGMTYQWYKNGSAISGASGSTYAIPLALTADTGAKFLVVVSNGAGSTTSTNATLTVVPSNFTTAQAIAQAKSTLSLLVNTKGSLGTSFWPTQGTTLQSDLAGANFDFTFYGRNLRWLRDSLHALMVSGGTSTSGVFDTGTYTYSSTFSGKKTYPYTITRTSNGYSYTMNGGSDGTWSGDLSAVSTWPDGTIQTVTLQNASFPGEMNYTYTNTASGWTSTAVPIYTDTMNTTLATASNAGGGAVQSVTGTIQRTKPGATKPVLVVTISSATWIEYATGAVTGQTHVWLPQHAAASIATTSFNFAGTLDFTAYQNNPTAATAVQDGPSWGWQALNSAGSTFTQVHLTGSATNGQGGSLSIDCTTALGNYPSLNMNQVLSATNAPVLGVGFTGSLQTPNQPLMTLVVNSANQGLFLVPTTLMFTYGSTILTGTGTYFPPLKGQTSSLIFNTNLKDQTGIEIQIQINTGNVLTGQVFFAGTAIGTISDVGFGPRVAFSDGTFQTLW